MVKETVMPGRRVWLIIFGAMLFAVIQYGVLLRFFLPPESRGSHPDAPALRTLFIRIASVLMIASLMWSRFRVPPRRNSSDPLPPPAEFQRESIISMALAEAIAVLGFVLCMITSGTGRDYLLFGMGAALVLLVTCLPKGLLYWAAHEAREAGTTVEGRPRPIE